MKQEGYIGSTRIPQPRCIIQEIKERGAVGQMKRGGEDRGRKKKKNRKK